MPAMNAESSWDFRDNQELTASHAYNKEGYIIEKADFQYLELIKHDIERAFYEFPSITRKDVQKLENAHYSISHDQSNNLRLHIMKKLYRNTSFHRNYYNTAKNIIHSLCGNELAMQKRPGLSINLPQNRNDVLPIHADTWNGVSPFELNIWIPLVNCTNSMCLYILKRDNYKRRLNDSKELLRLTSDELFNELRDDLTWIPIEYGEILAFDQSLPHGYSLNEERDTHWSINCRFKGLHTPYWDKKLGEYFMPITVKNCTRLGMNYSHPDNWI
ncbi:sporadic carbohydrate cluster 2OG-Fe(II) oxygenase [Synechococcus sp. A15-24]|uniref:sporadic carbohydrate cluster 2OG-Fe(II) oxygenase n=1 Tax=Synechococcus sp. A15-24 TaxID=1050635 RepID=UPI0016457310|nr:sporadic carbohydrate cluster 2OG-Fe(II) oxygenase [Synechococcus sp. A15-24]